MRLQPRQSGRSLLDLVIVLLSIAGLVAANDRNHKYTAGERVQLWVNKVGPYNNPQETYNYYYLPFCRAKPEERPQHRWAGLGEVLEGNELIDSQLSISFKEPVEKMAYCQQMLSPRSAATFRRAIRHHYWYEFFLDDLPIWGFIGDNVVGDGAAADGRQLIYTHKAFDIGFNGPHIIQVNLTSGDPVPLEDGQILEFTYSVAWKEMSLPFHRRFERYLDYNFFEHQIHWFSIFNSFMMVLFLVGLVSMILMRTLKKDYQRYAKDDDDIETLERDLSQESGWKLLHGDVFRAPPRLSLLCALVGTGAQLALLVLFVILITIAGTLFIERGTIVTVFILCYALTSFVGGYVSGGMHARHGGRTWIPTMLLTASLLPGLFFGIAFLLNTIAILYHSLEAAPFTTIVIMLLIWAFISFPLCLLGTVLGRNWSGTARNPCRTKRIPSPIPAKTWYLRPTVIAIMGGLLPFGSIFIELYFIFTSFWNNKIYFVYGFMLLVFVMLCVVTACITIVATYFLLNAENYLWHWTSFHSAASTGIYVYVYSIHYFLFKTKMTGFFQTAFYFGYMAMFCMGLSILCGAVGYLSAASFVKRIYRNIKCD